MKIFLVLEGYDWACGGEVVAAFYKREDAEKILSKEHKIDSSNDRIIQEIDIK